MHRRPKKAATFTTCSRAQEFNGNALSEKRSFQRASNGVRRTLGEDLATDAGAPDPSGALIKSVPFAIGTERHSATVPIARLAYEETVELGGSVAETLRVAKATDRSRDGRRSGRRSATWRGCTREMSGRRRVRKVGALKRVKESSFCDS